MGGGLKVKCVSRGWMNPVILEKRGINKGIVGSLICLKV